MKITGVIFLLCLTVSVIAQSVALSASLVWMALPGALAGLVWAIDFWRGKHRLGNLSFLILLAMISAGLWMKLSSFLLLASAVTALMAWDLDGFGKQIRAYDPKQGNTPVVRAHMSRLFIVAAAGYVLGALPLLVKTRFGLPVAVLLGVLLVIGLSQAVHYLRNL